MRRRRFHMDHEFGALGHSRRADIVLLNDALEPQSTWYGGVLAVENRRITPALDAQLESARYVYPRRAYETVVVGPQVALVPPLPSGPCVANTIRTELPGIVLIHDQVALNPDDGGWDALLDKHGLCFAAVIERHGRGGGVGLGLLKDFGLRSGAVASSVGHDAHNIIVAGRTEADMRLAAGGRSRRARAVWWWSMAAWCRPGSICRWRGCFRTSGWARSR